LAIEASRFSLAVAKSSAVGTRKSAVAVEAAGDKSSAELPNAGLGTNMVAELIPNSKANVLDRQHMAVSLHDK
jgi:hypothetical protein